jgi:sulfite reductase (NADPH) flavoprotein alpha-component
MASQIKIPDDAPFTPEQRAWLGEFLAKLVSGAPAVESGPAVPVTVLYASQTGTAEGLAKKLLKTLKKGNFEPEVHDIGGYDIARLPKEKNLLVITSTYGDGEPPDSAIDFHAKLMSDAAPRLEGVSFSVLALGDTGYPDFCKCGIEFDTRFEALGGTRLFPRVDCDVDVDEPYATWSAGALAVLAPAGAATASNGTAQAEPAETGFSKKNPFPSPVLKNFNLNSGGEKETHHIEFSLEGSELAYEVGDALGVYPVNDAGIVDEIIAALPFKSRCARR